MTIVWTLRAAIFAGLAAAFYVSIFPPFDHVALTWVAVTPLLMLFPAPTAGAGALAGGLFGTLAAVGLTASWLAPAVRTFFGLSPVAAGTAVLLVAVVTGGVPLAVLGVALQRLAALPSMQRVLLTAAAWVAVEYARGTLPLAMPWGTLGAAVPASSLPAQIADVGGVYGVSYLAVLAAAAVASRLVAQPAGSLPGWRSRPLREPPAGSPQRQRRARDSRVGALVVALALIGLACVYGAVRRSEIRALMATAPTVRVAIAHAELPNDRRQGPAQAAAALGRYLELSPTSGGSVDLVLWPENAINLLLEENPDLVAQIAARAGSTRYLVGAPRTVRDGDRVQLRTSVLVIGAGGVEATYDKRRLLPFAETVPSLRGAGSALARGFTAGAGAVTLDVGTIRVGPSLCYEATFPALMRAETAAGAQLLVNLSNDSWFPPGGGPAQHFVLGRLRAVESRRALVRAANRGVTAVVLPDGSAIVTTDGSSPGLETALVPLLETRTPYVRVGDAFALLCVAATLLAMVVAPRRNAGDRAP